MQPESILGMIFDLDGTLGDTLPVVFAAMQETFLRYAGRAFTHAEITAMFGPAEEGIIAQHVAPADYPKALAFYFARYEAHQAQVAQPFPGVLELLEELRERGVRRGLVTGKGAVTAAVSLRCMGLADLIETVETGSSAGAEKPLGIRRVLADWELPPARAAYVGDTPYDMQAAREAGVLPLAAGWAATAHVRPGGDEARFFSAVADLRGWLLDGKSA